MSFQPTNILIFGATGVIGKPIVDELINEKASFRRIAIFTSQGAVTSKADVIRRFEESGVEVFVGDLSDHEYTRHVLEGTRPCSPLPWNQDGKSTSPSPLEPFDSIISAVGRTAISLQIELLRLAEAVETVKRFFPSEYGTDIEFDATSASEPPHQQKLKVRAFINSFIKRLECTYLVTGPYSDLFLSKMSAAPRMGSFDVQAKHATLLYQGEDPISFTSISEYVLALFPCVAKLVVCALKRPEVSRNTVLKVNSFTATPKQILAEFEAQTGGEKWAVEYVPKSEFRELERNAYAQGSPLAHLYTLRRIWADGGTLYPVRDNERLGFTQPETLRQGVAKALESTGEAFRSRAM